MYFNEMIKSERGRKKVVPVREEKCGSPVGHLTLMYTVLPLYHRQYYVLSLTGEFGVESIVFVTHTTIGCGEQGFPSAQPYLSHILNAVNSQRALGLKVASRFALG
jgi:hypothetical protein